MQLLLQIITSVKKLYAHGQQLNTVHVSAEFLIFYTMSSGEGKTSAWLCYLNTIQP